VRRYVRQRPGELVHTDVKKLAAIPDRGGHRTRGRGYPNQHARRRVCCRFIHSALHDRSRLACSEAHHDERAVTAAGFRTRAAAWCASRGVARVERVLTGNGHCYRSSQWRQARNRNRTANKRTRPYRPQTTRLPWMMHPETYGEIITPSLPASDHAPTGPRPTVNLSASTASSSKNGSTSATGPQNPTRTRLPNTPTQASSTTTTTTRSHRALKRATPASTLNDNLPQDNLPEERS